jgi:acyl-ACP thioesterase
VALPENLAEELPNTIPAFSPLEASAEGMEERYERTVRVTDLDKSRHMTNLRYIEMFQDAHGSQFWKTLNPTEMEISFLSQCREGETLSVRSKADGNTVHLAAVHADGTLASVAAFY